MSGCKQECEHHTGIHRRVRVWRGGDWSAPLWFCDTAFGAHMRMGFIVEEIDSDRPRFYGRLDVLGYNIEHAIDHMWTVREMAEVVAARFGARVGKTTIPDGCPEGVQMLEVVGFRSESDRDRFWRLLEIAQPGRTWQLHCRDLPTQREL